MLIFIFWLLWPKKIYLSRYEKKNIEKLQIKPSKVSFLIRSNNLYISIGRIAIRKYFKSDSFEKKEINNIGKYGEFAFSKENKYARPQIKLSNSNFNGIADFIDKYKVYEIKTTEYDGYIKDYYQKKWINQLKTYMYLADKQKGMLVVYRYDRSRSRLERSFHKTIIADESIKNLDKRITAVKNRIVEEGYVYYKPISIIDGWRAFRLSHKTKKANIINELENESSN